MLFGVTPTIKAIKWCQRKAFGKPKSAGEDVEDPELEYGTSCSYSPIFAHIDRPTEGQDPYHSPTHLLKRFITRYSDARTAVPPTIYFPAPPQSSPLLPSASARRRSAPPLSDDLQDRLRLAQFQFPAVRRTSASHSSAAPPAPLPDLFSSSARYSQCSTDTDLETLDGLVLGGGVRHKSLCGSSVNSGDYAALAEVDLNDEKPRADGDGVRLPCVPPPAYLDLDRQMEPERFDYDSA